jgi:ubiquitin C-terminal hydrolase
MKSSLSENKIDVKKTGFLSASSGVRFRRNKKTRFISDRPITAVVNTNFCNSSNGFNWARLRRDVAVQPVSELVINRPTLESCLTKFGECQVLDENNQWFCPVCREFVCAEKQMTVWSLPKCLMFQLKRFCSTKFGLRKMETDVSFPEEIDFSGHVEGPQRESSQIYRLYGVIQHFGQLNSGHYLASVYVESAKKWATFNDAYVKEMGNESVHQPNAYVLFYQRIDEK